MIKTSGAFKGCTLPTNVKTIASCGIANTEAEAQDLINLYHADKDHVTVVNPGVDLDVFSPGDQVSARKELGIPQDAIVFTFVGRVQPLKAPDVLIKAAHQFILDHPSLRNRVRVVICGGLSGTGFDKPQALVSLVNELHLNENVIFLPPSSREKLATLYKASTLVAVPSYSESFGLVAVEAQACGTPVIATNVRNNEKAKLHQLLLQRHVTNQEIAQF